MGDKSADNILRSIDASRDVPFQRVLFAIGIRFVGETTAKNLALHFRSMDALMNATPEELAAADEVGDKIALSIVDYFRDEANRKIVARLRESGLRFEIGEKQLLSNALDGLKFVISGTFSEHSRDQLKELIESHGGRNQSGVSANTDYLLGRGPYRSGEVEQGAQTGRADYRRGRLRADALGRYAGCGGRSRRQRKPAGPGSPPEESVDKMGGFRQK